ncbi:MAG: CCA tRNA nucleotidyltransferase [Eubacterium sp.]|nr:CCA tRNA nucleotidyltransferase [Eubacterium sp.]
MKIEMPENVKNIIKKIRDAGYEAYIVGGCVRDCILGRQPNDWDITTSAKPEEIKALYRRTIDTGIKHGTVSVMIGNERYEITTYRIDGMYTDHRRPDDVTFTSHLSEDLLRRDFTINAMAYNDEEGLVDIYGGMEDIEKKVIRCVGKANDRFDEDALRIMRAVRFAAQLGFNIEEETYIAGKEHAGDLKNVSAERIETELTKLLLSPHPEELITMYELGITDVILPEFSLCMETPQNSPYHKYDVGRHTVEVIKNVPATKIMRYAALLHDIGKPLVKTTDSDGVDHFKTHAVKSEEMAEDILRRLRMDNDTIRDVKIIILWHDYGISGNITKKSVRRMLSKMGEEYYESLIEIKKADMIGQSDFRLEEKKDFLNNFMTLHDEIILEKSPLTMKEMAIGGKELIDMGIKPGPEMGSILKKIFDMILDDPDLNVKEKLLDIAKSIVGDIENEE